MQGCPNCVTNTRRGLLMHLYEMSFLGYVRVWLYKSHAFLYFQRRPMNTTSFFALQKLRTNQQQSHTEPQTPSSGGDFINTKIDTISGGVVITGGKNDIHITMDADGKITQLSVMPFKYFVAADSSLLETVVATLRTAANKSAIQLISQLKLYEKQHILDFQNDSAAEIYRSVKQLIPLKFTEKNFTRSWY